MSNYKCLHIFGGICCEPYSFYCGGLCPLADNPIQCKYYEMVVSTDWEIIEEGKYKCKRCGRIYTDILSDDICICKLEEMN